MTEVRIVPYLDSHLDMIEIQEGQKHLMAEALRDKGYRRAVLEQGQAWTVIGDNVQAIGGYLDLGYGRIQLWCMLGKDVNMLYITRTVLKRLDKLNFKRCEMLVEAGFKQAHRWAGMLGFRCETPNGMQNVMPGVNMYMYARIR